MQHKPCTYEAKCAVHFSERAGQRQLTLLEQQLSSCLKYGEKSADASGLRTIFQLGSIRIMQCGSGQGDLAIL